MFKLPVFLELPVSFLGGGKVEAHTAISAQHARALIQQFMGVAHVAQGRKWCARARTHRLQALHARRPPHMFKQGVPFEQLAASLMGCLRDTLASAMP